MVDFLDFNRSSLSSEVTTERFTKIINEAMEVSEQASEKRNYLGGSRLGVECARMLQYEYMGAPKSRNFSGEILRIFERGHASEANMIKRLRLAGFEIQTETEHGGQLGFTTANGRIKGHYDGLIRKAPGMKAKVPMLWEHKCLGNKGFNAVVKHGVAKEKPVYASQVATYQAYSRFTNPALFTVENADTGRLYAEMVPFDPRLAQEATDRGVDVLQAVDAGEMLPRPYPDREFFKCAWCDYNGECWG